MTTIKSGQNDKQVAIEQDALQQTLRFLPGSVEDFCEKVEAICEPGNRAHYSSPSFCYLQSRLTGKTRMLLAKKRGIYSLYFSCRRQQQAHKSFTSGFLEWLSRGQDDLTTALALKEIVTLFAQKIIQERLNCGGYMADSVIGGVGGFSVLSLSPKNVDLSLVKQLLAKSTDGRQQHEPGKIVIAFDDAACLLRRQHIMYKEGRKVAVRVNMLRWIRHCISTEVAGDFFWNSPVVFCDSSPEIDKIDPVRRGECVDLDRECPPRVFMPLILHDAFDLFTDKVAETSFEVNTRMAWHQHIQSARYMIELSFYGRPIWGAMTNSLLRKANNNYGGNDTVVKFIETVFEKAQVVFKERYDFAKVIKQESLGRAQKPHRHLVEAAIVVVLASTFGIFDIHSTNLNLLFAKNCLSELLALDMEGRVCFSAFPSEPLVACQTTHIFFSSKAALNLIVKSAIEFHHIGIITLDNCLVFLAQSLLMLSIPDDIVDGVEWATAVKSTPMARCLPRKCCSFLPRLIGEELMARLLSIDDNFIIRELLNGSVAFSHFATVDMDDLVAELGQIDMQERHSNGSLNCHNNHHFSFIDAVQLVMTVGRLVGRNSVGIVAEPWRGIDLIVPVICVSGQLGCLLIAVCSDPAANQDKEDALDHALLELAHMDPSMFLATPQQPPKHSIPSIGIVLRELNSSTFSASFKQLSSAIRITTIGISHTLSDLLSPTTLSACTSAWDRDGEGDDDDGC